MPTKQWSYKKKEKPLCEENEKGFLGEIWFDFNEKGGMIVPDIYKGKVVLRIWIRIRIRG